MDSFVHAAPLISAIVSLINLVGLIVVALETRAAAKRRDFHAIEKRVTTLEQKSLPGWNDINDLKKWLTDIHADVEKLSSAMDGHHRLLERTEHTVRLL